MMPTLWLKSNKIDQHKKGAKIDIDQGERMSIPSLLVRLIHLSVDDEPDPAEKESFSVLQKSEKQKIETRKSLSARWGKLIACKK